LVKVTFGVLLIHTDEPVTSIAVLVKVTFGVLLIHTDEPVTSVNGIEVTVTEDRVTVTTGIEIIHTDEPVTFTGSFIFVTVTVEPVVLNIVEAGNDIVTTALDDTLTLMVKVTEEKILLKISSEVYHAGFGRASGCGGADCAFIRVGIENNIKNINIFFII
jgi:hypothetical protein